MICRIMGSFTKSRTRSIALPVLRERTPLVCRRCLARTDRDRVQRCPVKREVVGLALSAVTRRGDEVDVLNKTGSEGWELVSVTGQGGRPPQARSPRAPSPVVGRPPHQRLPGEAAKSR